MCVAGFHKLTFRIRCRRDISLGASGLVVPRGPIITQRRHFVCRLIASGKTTFSGRITPITDGGPTPLSTSTTSMAVKTPPSFIPDNENLTSNITCAPWWTTHGHFTTHGILRNNITDILRLCIYAICKASREPIEIKYDVHV